MQQTGHGQSRERGKFRGFEQDRVASEQRRHQHISTRKPWVVPCRNIGHYPERQWLDLLGHAAFVKDRAGQHHGIHLVEEKIDAFQQAVEFTARHGDGFACLAGHDGGQGLDLCGHRGAESGEAVFARGQRLGLPVWLRRACRCCLEGDGRGVVGGHFGEERVGGGVINREWDHDGERQVFFTAWAAARKSTRSGVSSIGSSSGRRNSGCHCTAAT